MRSITTHAVWSGVGEFTARESESAKCKPPGKNDWRSSTPQFSPENFGSPGFFVSGDLGAVGLREFSDTHGVMS